MSDPASSPSAASAAPLGPESEERERILYEGQPALVHSLGAILLSILTLGLWLIVLVFRRNGRHYKVTSERVVVETGIFSKEMQQLDLYRINDYTVERPFGQRLVGTGNLVLHTMDQSSPHLRIEGIRADVRTLYEELRKATEIQKRRRGVRVVDYE